MLGVIWMLSNHLHGFLRRFMPTNIFLAGLFTRRGLKWGVPAMLIAGLYIFAAALCTELIEQGAPGWVNPIVLLFLWDALKFIAVRPASLVCLVRVRAREARIRYWPVSDGARCEPMRRAPARVLH